MLKKIIGFTFGVICFISVAYGATINASRIHLVAYQHNNWFFRGGLPLEKDTQGKYYFAYQELVQYLRVKANEAGHPLPEKFFLVDVSLLTPIDPTQLKALGAESSYFTAHPDQGKLIVWPVLGSLISPNQLSAQDREVYIKTKLPAVISVDKLPDRMTAFQAMFTKSYAIPYVFYVHCQAGCDRMGEFAAAYRMQYQDMSLADVWQTNVNDCGRDPNYFSKNAQEWYCYILGRDQAACSSIDK